MIGAVLNVPDYVGVSSFVICRSADTFSEMGLTDA